MDTNSSKIYNILLRVRGYGDLITTLGIVKMLNNQETIKLLDYYKDRCAKYPKLYDLDVRSMIRQDSKLRRILDGTDIQNALALYVNNDFENVTKICPVCEKPFFLKNEYKPNTDGAFYVQKYRSCCCGNCYNKEVERHKDQFYIPHYEEYVGLSQNPTVVKVYDMVHKQMKNIYYVLKDKPFYLHPEHIYRFIK